MSVNGSLETVSLAGILQLLCNEKQTGILHLENQGSRFQICFLKGYIVYAAESSREARLGNLLVEGGVLTRDQLESNLALARKRKVALGMVLVDTGAVPIAVLEKYIYRQVEEIVFILFQWKTGNFSFTPSPLNLRWLVIVELNTLQLIVDASRRLDELSS